MSDAEGIVAGGAEVDRSSKWIQNERELVASNTVLSEMVRPVMQAVEKSRVNYAFNRGFSVPWLAYILDAEFGTELLTNLSIEDVRIKDVDLLLANEEEAITILHQELGALAAKSPQESLGEGGWRVADIKRDDGSTRGLKSAKIGSYTFGRKRGRQDTKVDFSVGFGILADNGREQVLGLSKDGLPTDGARLFRYRFGGNEAYFVFGSGLERTYKAEVEYLERQGSLSRRDEIKVEEGRRRLGTVREINRVIDELLLSGKLVEEDGIVHLLQSSGNSSTG